MQQEVKITTLASRARDIFDGRLGTVFQDKECTIAHTWLYIFSTKSAQLQLHKIPPESE